MQIEIRIDLIFIGMVVKDSHSFFLCPKAGGFPKSPICTSSLGAFYFMEII